MTRPSSFKITLLLAVCTGLIACGGQNSARSVLSSGDAPAGGQEFNTRSAAPTNYERSSLWDAFGPNKGDQTVNVNRFIWAATLDVLNFLPVQSIDPFTGVIVTGYGTPPGGRQSYRATVHISDPALEARSLNLALQSRSGAAVSPATTRAVEDAILSRARQLRIGEDAL